MSPQIELNPVQIEMIRKLAEERRRTLGFVGDTPVANDIFTILDKFDTLTNSITEGLPREIELRQKQYEYYRDKLLSFNVRRHIMDTPKTIQ